MLRQKAVHLALILCMVSVFLCITLVLPQPFCSQFLLGYTEWDNPGQTRSFPYTLWGNYGAISGQQFPFYNYLRGYNLASAQQFPVSANWGGFGFPLSQQISVSANWGNYNLASAQQFPVTANLEAYRLKTSEPSVIYNMQGVYGTMPQTASSGYTASGSSGPYSLPPPGYAAEYPYYFPSTAEGFYKHQENEKAWKDYLSKYYPWYNPDRAYEVYVLGSGGGGFL